MLDEPPPTIIVGDEVTVKSLALAPLKKGVSIYNGSDPVFWTTNVRVVAPLKSVKSVAEGVMSPSTIELPLPVMFISTFGGLDKVKLEVTPPGAVQLEVVPPSNKPKLLSVPFLLLLDSVNVVTSVLIPL